MADLASISKDPNFVNANAATKQAIFDKWAPQDPNYSNANAATQQAIRQKFGIAVSEQPSPEVAAAAPAEPELTTGQKVYKAVRPYVAPIVEAGGAIAGGLIGAGAGTLGGPVGTAAGGVAGAGLGYGIAKEALEQADVGMGMKAPRQGMQHVTEPIRNVLEGASFEAGGRVAASAIGKTAELAAGAVKRFSPQQKAAEIARDALGPDLPEALNALRAAQGQGLNAAQATAFLNSPTWQALVERASARDPRFANALATAQGEESINALAKLVGGTTAAEGRTATKAAKEALTKATEPAREAALTQASPKKPEISALVENVRSIARNPRFAGDDVIEGAVKNVAKDIEKWVKEGGDAQALDAIRKNSVNAVIAKLRPGMDATAQRNLASSVLTDIKPLLIDAIEESGGKGYRQYLQDYAKGAQQIAEKKLSGEALKMWKTNKDEFVRLVQNESPEAVEKILGPGRYDIAKELSETTMSTLRTEADKVIRDANIKSQVQGGQAALKELLLQHTSKLRLPSYLTAVATSTNTALNILQNKIGQKTMAKLTEAVKTPEGAADLLKTLPAIERNRVAQILSDPSRWKTGGSTATMVAGKDAIPGDQDEVPPPSRNNMSQGSKNAMIPP